MSRFARWGASAEGFRRVARRVWPYLRPQAGLVVGSTLALAAGTLLRLLEPWPLKLVVDRVVRGGDTERAPAIPGLAALAPPTLLAICCVAVVVIMVLRALADYANTVGFARIANRTVSVLRDDLYRHLQALSLSFHTSARGGDLVVRVTNDVNRIRDVTTTAFLPLVASGFLLAGMWAVMFALEWRLALLALATLPVLGVSTLRLSRRIHEAARRQRVREGAMAATAAESITAIKVVQALSLEAPFAASFSSRSRESQSDDVRGSRLAARLSRTVDVLLAVSTALVLYFGARLALSGEMSAGDIIVFLSYLKRAFNPIQDFAKYTGRMAKGLAATERVFALLDREPDVRDLPGAVRAPTFAGRVRFENVSFGYRVGRHALHGVSFEALPGQRVAVVGPSGAGKSTLVGLLLRLYDPTGGCVTIDGRDVRDYTLRSVRRQISVILQESILFATSVRENIACGTAAASPFEVEAAARLANAHEFILALPEGYDTVLGERGATLSGGQRQRIAIARAAVRRAPILILDEPTAGLDEENERGVLEALDRISAGRTTFVVTHDLRLAARADKILYLENGRVVESGTCRDLLGLDGRFARLFRLQTSSNSEEKADALAS